MTHYDASVYCARRMEMLNIVEATLFYLVDRPVVHSEVSGLPFMVSFSFEFLFKLRIFFLRSNQFLIDRAVLSRL